MQVENRTINLDTRHKSVRCTSFLKMVLDTGVRVGPYDKLEGYT